MLIRVNLERVRPRADFFVEAASVVCEREPYSRYGFTLTRRNAEYLAECYFLLNDAYKAHRSRDGHKTLPSKIAAMTSLVVAVLNPLRPSKPPNKPNSDTLYANPMFAVRVAQSILGHDYIHCPFSRVKPFYDQFRNVNLPSLEPYILSIRRGREVGEEYCIELSSPEIALIDNRILLFTPD